jgi:hypothetical protein
MLINLAPPPGIEPGTLILTGCRSTAELRRNFEDRVGFEPTLSELTD